MFRIISVIILAATAAIGQELTLQPVGRRVFIRNEANAHFKLELTNPGTTTQSPQLTVSVSSTPEVKPLHVQLPHPLPPGKTATVEIPLETRLTCGTYQLAVQAGSGPVRSFPFTIAPVRTDFMPVVMWGYNGSFRLLQEAGFTHGQRTLTTTLFNAKDPAALVASETAELDRMLADGFYRTDYFTLPHLKELQAKYPRYDRQGKVRPGRQNVEVSNPAAIREFTDFAQKITRLYGDYPALDAVLIHSEVRDHSQPSFGQYEPAAFEKFAGYPIPGEIENKKLEESVLRRHVPFSRVVPDNDPLLTYFRWFWKEGDGWNPAHNAVHRTYHQGIKRPFWTFFDPALRTPPIWGSGGEVDFINHWTYTYPDPIRSGALTDELRAMAAGRPGQGVMSMTQAICYRSQVAPIGRQVAAEPPWVKANPKAAYITIPPDFVANSVWSQIARRIDGIMFHGFGSLWQAPPANAYVMTNPEALGKISDVLRTVIRPLGPLLKRIPERPAEVAVLHSFTSSILAGRGTWGWSGWPVDLHLALQWANLSPSVIYEEEILRDGFKNLKILVMPHCDVLTESMFRKIQEFQQRGGIIIADEFLTPGLMPDILVPQLKLSSNAEARKQRLQAIGRQIRRELGNHYRPYSDADQNDLVTRVRSTGTADYLFVINDRRSFGDYIGAYHLAMDRGEPNSGTVAIDRPAGAVYDLVNHIPVPFAVENGRTSFRVNFATTGGQLFLIVPEPLEQLKITAPPSALQGKSFTYTVQWQNRSGQPIPALWPLQITLRNAAGKVVDGSGYAVAENGQYQQRIEVPLNEPPGNFTVSVRELASGREATATVKINLPVEK